MSTPMNNLRKETEHENLMLLMQHQNYLILKKKRISDYTHLI